MDVFTWNLYINTTFMASSHYIITRHCPSLFRSFRTCSISNHKKAPECLVTSRRCLISISLGGTFLYRDFFYSTSTAAAFDFRMAVPDQTPEEANRVIKPHARNLLKIKPFIDSKSWKDIVLTLRGSSPSLKQDLYTIIQSKPPSERGELRRLYNDLFDNVTTLDHAAEDNNENQVQECYDNIVTDLDKIFARI